MNSHDGQTNDGNHGNLSNYEKGLKSAENGQYEQALVYMQEYLLANKNDAQALNDTGAILHCLGRSKEAIDHFLKARSLKKDSGEMSS